MNELGAQNWRMFWHGHVVDIEVIPWVLMGLKACTAPFSAIEQSCYYMQPPANARGTHPGQQRDGWWHLPWVVMFS